MKIKLNKSNPKKPGEVVVLLHGSCGSNKNMECIADSMRILGYHIYSMEFNSSLNNSTDAAKTLSPRVKYISSRHKKIHFIAHSMGGLIVRKILSEINLKNVDKVIQIATPNHGSELATFFKGNWLYKKIYGKAWGDFIIGGKFLKSLNEPHVSAVGATNYELGSIAGNSSHFLLNFFFKSKDNDRRVSVSSTKLEGMKDHIIINANHRNIIKSKETILQIKSFLLDGKFDRSTSNLNLNTSTKASSLLIETECKKNIGSRI